ncbi:MAG: ATP-binding protein [bacterium]|nr:ATP-binding protein [bacterium]
MIYKVETLYYRCLRYNEQHLDSFHVLVGPNASGKTTFLDAITFLGDLVSSGLETAIRNRADDLQDLIWHRRTNRFELAVELRIPRKEGDLFVDHEYGRCRYEIAVGPLPDTGEPALLSERVLLLADNFREDIKPVQQSLFPVDRPTPDSLATPRVRGVKTVVHKISGGNDKFYDETGTGWDPSFRLGPRKSALANLPEDETRFPIATWLKSVFQNGIQRLVLNSALMKRPSPPAQLRRFSPDGSNLPWVVASLGEHAPSRLNDWVANLRDVLPDLETISTIERPEDRHRYLVLRDRSGLEIPSWLLSDGTLRLLALTLPAYLPNFEGIYLVEEPENGIHPRGVETVFHSLSAVPNAQILVTTHSPVMLNAADPSCVLCFTRTETGAIDIVPGAELPALQDWRGETDLGRLSAGGVLG